MFDRCWIDVRRMFFSLAWACAEKLSIIYWESILSKIYWKSIENLSRIYREFRRFSWHLPGADRQSGKSNLLVGFAVRRRRVPSRAVQPFVPQLHPCIRSYSRLCGQWNVGVYFKPPSTIAPAPCGLKYLAEKGFEDVIDGTRILPSVEACR